MYGDSNKSKMAGWQENKKGGADMKMIRKIAVIMSLLIALSKISHPVNAKAAGNGENLWNSLQVQPAFPDGQTDFPDSRTLTAKSKSRAVYRVIVRNGHKCWMQAQALGTEGKVKWSTDNPKILKLLAKNNKECTVMPLKDGRATMTAKAKNKTITYQVFVRSGKKFLDTWCRQWVRDYITDETPFETKLIMASAYVTSNNNRYGNTSEPEDVITTGVGNCVSGGELVACLCRAMGYDAKLRFAAKDDMSRYPSNMIFMEQHHNVEVTVDGKKYYIDGTPGGMMVYLSTRKRLLYCGFAIKNKIYPEDELINVPIEELLG